MNDVHVATVREADGDWVELSSAIETWSEFHQGRNPGASGWFYLVFGSPPPGIHFDVEPFHAITYIGTMRVRYDAKLKATFCKFCNSGGWTDKAGKVHSSEEQLGAQQREMMERTAVHGTVRG